MKKYIQPTTTNHVPQIGDICKAYPWPESQMPATGGYAWPQKLPHTKEADVNEEEEKVDECEFGNLW